MIKFSKMNDLVAIGWFSVLAICGCKTRNDGLSTSKELVTGNIALDEYFVIHEKGGMVEALQCDGAPIPDSRSGMVPSAACVNAKRVLGPMPHDTYKTKLQELASPNGEVLAADLRRIQQLETMAASLRDSAKNAPNANQRALAQSQLDALQDQIKSLVEKKNLEQQRYSDPDDVLDKVTSTSNEMLFFPDASALAAFEPFLENNPCYGKSTRMVPLPYYGGYSCLDQKTGVIYALFKASFAIYDAEINNCGKLTRVPSASVPVITEKLADQGLWLLFIPDELGQIGADELLTSSTQNWNNSEKPAYWLTIPATSNNTIYDEDGNGDEWRPYLARIVTGEQIANAAARLRSEITKNPNLESPKARLETLHRSFIGQTWRHDEDPEPWVEGVPKGSLVDAATNNPRCPKSKFRRDITNNNWPCPNEVMLVCAIPAGGRVSRLK